MIVRVINGGQSHEFEQQNVEDCSLSILHNRIKENFSDLPYVYTLNYLARDKEPLRLKNQSDYEKLFELVNKQRSDNPLAILKNERKVIKLIVFAKNNEQKAEDTNIMGTKQIKTITEKLQNMILVGEQQKTDQLEDDKGLDLDKICQKVKNLKLLQEKNQVKEEMSSSDAMEQEKEQKINSNKKQFAEDIGKSQLSDSQEDEDDDDDDDNDPTKPIHNGVQCDNCDRYPIKGIRWKCSICPNYDLCENCQFMDLHNSVHPLLKIKVPLSFIPQQSSASKKKIERQTKRERKQKKRKQKQKLQDDLMSNEALQILVISRASLLSEILVTDYEKCFKLVLKHPMKSQSELIDIYFQKFKSVHA